MKYDNLRELRERFTDKEFAEMLPGSRESCAKVAARIAELEVELDQIRALFSDYRDGPIIDKIKDVIAEVERLREPVRWFAEHMERKLQRHDHKGGWSDCTVGWLLKCLYQEIDEMRAAWSGGGVGDGWEAVIDEAADVANFAMMIANNARARAALAKEE